MPQPYLRKIGSKPVEEAKSPLHISITAEDVKKGSRKAPDACAAALACKKLPGVVNARVHSSRVYIETPKKWVVYHTPVNLTKEIVAFDRGGKFYPGEFNLAAPPPSDTVEKRRAYRVNRKVLLARKERYEGKTDPELITKRKNPRKLRITQGIRNRFNTR